MKQILNQRPLPVALLSIGTTLGLAPSLCATDYNFGSATQNFTIPATDSARVVAPATTFADTGAGGIYWRGTAADSVYMHFDLSSLQGVTLDTPVSLKQTINAQWGGQTTGSAINTANAAWTAVTGGTAPGYTAIAGATNATGNFATGATATWSVPAATFAAYIDNPAFHGLVLSGASGTTAHFSTAATLTGTYTGGEVRVLNGTDWSAASWDGGTKTLSLSGASDVTGGNMILGAGTTLSISGSATLGGGTFAGTFANSGTLLFGGSASQAINGTFSGAGGLTKLGTGSTLTLNAASTFTGATTVTEGTLASNNLTGYRSNVNIATGATFEAGVATNVNASNSFNITGTGTLVKTGAGTWLLGSGGRVGIAMGAGGLIDIREGAMGTGSHQQSFTGNQASLKVAAGAKLDLAAENATFDGLTGGGEITNGYPPSGGRTLTLGVAGGSGDFSGSITSTVLAVAKTGTGTQTLSGSNTYTLGTTVSEGRLNINGSITSSATVGAAGTNATLGGDGTITGGVTLGANGILRPGHGGITDRTLTITGNVTTTAGSQMVFNIDGENAYDQLISNGTVSLANAALGVNLTDTTLTLLGAGQGADFLNSGASFYQLISGTTTGMFGNVTETMDANLLGHFGLTGTQYVSNINGQDFWVAQGSTYLVAIPEVSSSLLALLGSATLLRRRRG